MYSQEFSQMNDQFEVLLSSAAEAILITDATGEIALINKRTAQVFGYEHEDLIGQPIHFLLPERFRGRHEFLFKSYLQSPRARQMGEGKDLYGLRKDGTEFPIEVSLSPLSVNDRLFIMAMVIDITRRKHVETQMLMLEVLQVELEKERELVELKERFVSMVTHEMRTPLSIIASAVTMLDRYRDRMPPEKQDDYIQRILSNAHHMAHLLDDILTLSRSRARADTFSPVPVDVSAYCYGLYDEFRQADRGQHEFTLYCGVDGTALLDVRVLNHILRNLLANAFKYTPPGGAITFEVFAEGNDLHFRVRDEGIGIPPEDLDRLFEPFHRARNAENYQGTGLGLAIVHQNLEIHGGTINCVSKPEHGTTFTVILPLVIQ